MAILKTQQPKGNLQEVAKKLEKAIGRPADSAKENRLRSATSAVMSGEATYADAERMYAVSQLEVQRFIERVFPNDEDKYEFLENCMISNAMLASSQFTRKFAELDAVDSARAAGIFAGKAVEIRKAREAGFKEAPINVTTIVALEKTLKDLIQQPIELNG